MEMEREMRQIFITGATGFIGQEVARELIERGYSVRALVRSPKKAALLESLGVELIFGDILEEGPLRKGLSGADALIHLAALAGVWHREVDMFYRINRDATRRLLEIAWEEGVGKIVVTSTAGVFGPSNGQEEHTGERLAAAEVPDTHYDRSKHQSEQFMEEMVRSGLPLVVVNPTRVYGPGLIGDSNATTRMVDLYLRGSWRFLPGSGHSVGNYVFIEDVVRGHILALENGKPGARYILGGENASFREFFATLAEVTGISRRLWPIPIPLMMSIAGIQLALANWFGRPPLITPPFVRRYNRNYRFSSERAMRELGYQPTPLRQGLSRTVDWLTRE